MIDIGTVTGFEVTTNKDGEDDVLMLQVEMSNSEDLQTIELIRGSGVDINPQVGSRVIVIDIAPSYRVAIAVDDGVVPSQDAGARETYAYDDSLTKMAWIKLGADETIEIANASGYLTVDASGNFDINGNLTVAP